MLLRAFCLLTTLCTPLLAAAEPSLPPRQIAPTDKAEFRHFVLDNGLKVVLVSDPKFNKSAATLAVSVGQIDDPFEHVGLAHFLEHMVSRGSEKYPGVADFSNYINTNGGSRNASTGTDITRYLFEVRHEAFEGALDRLAHCFIAPLLPADVTEREVNAVHNEAMRHVQNDQRRMLNVRRELYHPAAGESKFSTGNKTTLAQADHVIVRAFMEDNYSSDRMALAVAGVASLDQLETWVRTSFSAVPRRDLPAVTREPIFLPRSPALRLATIEPVKEIRQLWLEFPIPATRPLFVSKPDQLLLSLLNTGGEGGLVQALKDANLGTAIGGFVWERTSAYGSLFLSAELTPQGAEDLPAVMELVFAYLQHLRESPFPADFHADQARIAALQETYNDRGEGYSLTNRLASNALYYPLELAARADIAWGAPDEEAYRTLLAALTPDNMLATFQAKGVTTDRTEEIYGSAYAYTETTGEAYARLVQPPAAAIAAFRLPGANPFLPSATPLLAERPLPLIDEPGLHLYYAQDVTFERPRATLRFRFVPARSIATAETDLLLRFYEVCLNDALEAAASEAELAGISASISAELEGLTLTVSGFGDSPARYAEFVVGQLLTVEVAPERFASLSERVIRTLRSFKQTEAFQLASARLNADLREFAFLPDDSLDRAATVTWSEVRDLARAFLATGRIEALVHGHLTPDQAVAATRAVAAAIHAKPLADEALLRRRHLVVAPGAPVLDVGVIEGVNSAYRAHYLLPDDSARTRAAATVISNFIDTPFFDELRTNQQLGYIVGSGATGSRGQLYLLFVIQSSAFPTDELRSRAETFMATLPDRLAQLGAAEWDTLRAGARAQLEEKPTSIAEKAARLFANAYDYDGNWERQSAALAALDTLTQAEAVALLRDTIDPAKARALIALLSSADHAPSMAEPSFTDRAAWKAGQRFE